MSPITYGRAPRSTTRRLPHDATAPAAARRITRSLLARWGWRPDSIDAAVLVVSELVTNAVEHARPPLRLRLRLRPAAPAVGSPDVRIKVSDGGPAAVPGPWTSSCAADEHGRGSVLIAHLSRPQAPGGPAHNRWVTVAATPGRVAGPVDRR
ncbi:ATP-binding protein [Streptomyces sp. NPDC057445]|uniref:ATP-binding protein n=1 Tax=Streptomyces sp. NPDC057445 TaxID=3346136 RepID=UPI00367B4FC5